MLFRRINPNPELQHIIECFWIIEDDNASSRKQKIIPDGFTELIFHFADPYRIKLTRNWRVQSNSLIAGQITKHFLLENTGRSNILGVKLKPTALTHLYELKMDLFTDKVANARSVLGEKITGLEEVLASCKTVDEKVAQTEKYVQALTPVKYWRETAADKAVELIFQKKGMISMPELAKVSGVGERQLENLFKKYVGLSPKFFSRIVRFNYIFDLVQKNKERWSLAYEAAYYDQSHFIRNFKTFTGENPSAYSFDESNMANFFLNKK